MAKTLADFDAENEDAEEASDLDFHQRARNRLRAIIERVERMDDEIKSLRDDRKDILAEAKAAGFDTAIIRLIVRRRKLDPASREEMDTMLDLYEKELGM